MSSARVGNAAGSYTRVTGDDGDQVRPSVTVLPGNTPFIAWVDQATGKIMGQSAYVAMGNPEFVIGTANADQATVEIVALTSDTFVAVWSSSSAPLAMLDTRARVYNSAGVAQTDEFSIASSSSNPEFLPDVAASGGTFVTTWITHNIVHARAFNQYGQETIADFAVSSGTVNTAVPPSIATLTNGGFAITWTSADGDVKARAFDASGAATSAELTLNGPNQDFSSSSNVIAHEDGFLVTWRGDTEVPGDPPTQQTLHARGFDALGNETIAEATFNSPTMGSEADPQISLLHLDGVVGGFLLVWTHNRTRYETAGTPQTGGEYQVYVVYDRDIMGQAFDLNGNKIGEEFVVNDRPTLLSDDGHRSRPYNQTDPNLANYDQGQILIAWTENNRNVETTTGDYYKKTRQ